MCITKYIIWYPDMVYRQLLYNINVRDIVYDSVAVGIFTAWKFKEGWERPLEFSYHENATHKTYKDIDTAAYSTN